MKIKNKFIILLTIFIVFYINVITKNEKIDLLTLGDEISVNYEEKTYNDFLIEYLKEKKKFNSYINNYNCQDCRITDLINKINNNEEIKINDKKITIQNSIKNSEIITISIGMKQIINNVKKNSIYIDISELMNDIDILLTKIRKLNKNKIIFIGLYNPTLNHNTDNIIKYSNKKLVNLLNKHNVIYINAYNIFKNNNHLVYNFIPNIDGHKLISQNIINNLKK